MDDMTLPNRLNLGCGDIPISGYCNVDIADRPGVDRVLNLETFPWPLPENHFEEVLLIDILEHLSDIIATTEEVWRISRNGALVKIRVPYWNSRWAWMDPQHKRTFHECSFDFFDPSKKYCKQRPYYSNARFTVEAVTYEGCWFFLGLPWKWRVKENKPKRVLHAATKLCDIVHFLQFELRVIK